MPESYDGIISIFCHLPKKIRQKLHKNIFASLKKGGTFILEAYTPQQLLHGTGGPPQEEMLMDLEEMLMDLEEIKKELEPLHLIYAREIEREIYDGTCHNGVGAVVQLIGMK